MSANTRESAALRFLYHTAAGRLLLRALCAPALSRAAGRFLDTRASRVLIGPFVRKNHIDLSECESADCDSFNACFSRTLKPELRPVDGAPTIDKIDLVTEGRVPGIDEATFVEQANAAKAGCAVSRALAGVAEITLDATLAT
mgnify:CR=1 FL=1